MGGHDFDRDGIPDDYDNCPFSPNVEQRDVDGDGIGDDCDNCSTLSNISQRDTDRDGHGNRCDDDDDNDTVADAIDNCPLVANGAQLDTNGDGKGDVCDEDDDGDGFADADDNCPRVANSQQGEPPAGNCDGDTDGDGIADSKDNCEVIANANQADQDNDGIGDACDADRDGDGVIDLLDNCPETPNSLQQDADQDRKGDSCDDRTCYTLPGSEEPCVDLPTRGPPKVVTPTIAVRVGDVILLEFFVNATTDLEYRWRLLEQPAHSQTYLASWSGNCRGSAPRWCRSTGASFERSGVYRLELTVEGGGSKVGSVLRVTATGGESCIPQRCTGRP